jgi:RNA polymerase sigma factor (sigma-70 family)
MSHEYWFVGSASVAPQWLELWATTEGDRGRGDLGRSSREFRVRRLPRSSRISCVIGKFSKILPNLETRGSICRDPQTPAMSEVQNLMTKVAELESVGAAARQRGDESAADQHFRNACDLALDAADSASLDGAHLTRVEVLHTATRLALERGETTQAKRIMAEAFAHDPTRLDAEEWAQFQEMSEWPDAWLIAAIRRDPPDAGALDTLAQRHWKSLFGRCHLLTLNHDKANDLGQEAWCRVLRVRRTLKPGGNLPAYLATVATNLWRDRNRSTRRAGPLAEERLLALDAALPDEDGQSVSLSEVLPDLNALQTQERAMLALDIDKALERLTPQLRDVLVARYIAGESCAEIGRRYGRTEQTISSWVRAAVREMKLYFEEQNSAVEYKEIP